MNLDESLFEFATQPRKRPLSYKKRVSKKPLSAKIYDALCDLRYEVFANNSFNGYTISKITNKMGKSTFIKNEEDFNRAIDLLNQYDITYKIENGIGGTKKLTFSLPEEDEDSVYDYFKNETNRDRAVNEGKENNINRRKRKGVHFNPNAGDVEKNIAFFNRVNTPNTPNSSCDSGECGNAMGESVESKDFHNRCKDILNNEIDWDEVDETGDVDFAINQLRSLDTEGVISHEEYDYIMSNWDDLLEENCNHINEEYGPYHYGDGEIEDTILHEISEDLSRGDIVGTVGDNWNGVTYGRWELLVNGDGVENTVKTNDMLEWLLTEISYPVNDGHTEYTGLNLIFDEYSIGNNSVEALQSNSAYIKDLISLDIDRETIDKFIKGETKEISFYVDYSLAFFKDGKSISFEDIIEQAQTADEDVTESIKMNKNKKFVLDESLFESTLNEATSNFGRSDYFPLLVFYTLDELVDENGDYRDEQGVAVLSDEMLDSLKSDIEDFNHETRAYAYDIEDYDDQTSLIELKLSIEPGYYEAAYVCCENENEFKYLSEKVREEQLERFNKFFKEMKEEYGLTELSVSARFSNGETFYDIKNESLMQDIHDAHEFIRKQYGQEVYDALEEYVANGHDLSTTMFSEEEWNKFVEWAKQNKGLVVQKPKNTDFIASLNPGKTKRTPKTKQVKVLQGNYGYGWDDLCEYEMNDTSSKQDLKDYQLNEPGVAHRIIYRRVPIEK